LNKGHGRVETRTIRTTANIDGIDFPNASQIFQIEREVFTQSTGKSTYEAVFGITSLGPDRADASRLLSLNRGHWSIENRSHYVRDVVFNEDQCRVRTGHAAHLLASMRNLAIGLLRLSGITCIARGIRQCMWQIGRAMTLIGLEVTD
jgi:hypothetical protein